MLKILIFLKQKLKKVLIWLWKTFSYAVFSLYLNNKKFLSQNLFRQKYLLCPIVTVLVVILTLAESSWLIQNQNPIQHIFLTKINQQKEEKIIEEAPSLLDKNQKINKNADFVIATTPQNKDDFIYPATTLGGAAIISPDLIDDELPVTRTGIETYIVQPGDTLESIAKKFNLKVETICWENQISPLTTLKVGQELRILPVDGLTHKVVAGDTLDKIARKYKSSVEDIIDFNNLADASDIFIGDILIVPFGKKPAPPKPKPTPPAKQKILFVNENYSNYNLWLKNTQCHRFFSGQCTSWVAFKWATVLGRCIPWTGHAKSWLNNAQNAGFKTGKEPKVGAIIVLKEAGWAARRYGHVAFVESIDDQNVTFSEMNFKGAWQITQRSYPLNDPHILGYIYPD